MSSSLYFPVARSGYSQTLGLIPGRVCRNGFVLLFRIGDRGLETWILGFGKMIPQGAEAIGSRQARKSEASTHECWINAIRLG